jgi:SAM-dependent methyltransferase
MLDFLGALAFRTVASAWRLGVFEALSAGPLTATELARRIRADERGTTVLLEALEALGYVKSGQGQYAATAMAAKWLPLLGDGIGFCEMLVERFQDLDESVRRGGPAIEAREWLNQRPDGWREFQAGMVALARITADEIVGKVKLPADARSLLDVGGGHGLYSIKFCRRNPQLSATVFDLPEGLEVTQATIASEGMEGRVSVQAGDFWIDDFGSGYDVALLFNIIHANLPEKNVELLQKVAGAITPGGLVVILDQLAGEVRGGTSRAFAALMGLNLFNLTGGQAYEFREIAGWLGGTGFASPHRIGLLKSPGTSLVVGTRAAAGTSGHGGGGD